MAKETRRLNAELLRVLTQRGLPAPELRGKMFYPRWGRASVALQPELESLAVYIIVPGRRVRQLVGSVAKAADFLMRNAMFREEAFGEQAPFVTATIDSDGAVVFDDGLAGIGFDLPDGFDQYWLDLGILLAVREDGQEVVFKPSASASEAKGEVIDFLRGSGDRFPWRQVRLNVQNLFGDG